SPAVPSGAGDLALFVGLDDVALLQVLEVRQSDAALEALPDLAGVLLEPLQRRDDALPDHDALAEEADLGATCDDARLHIAAGDGTHTRDPEDLAHLGVARDDFLVLRRQQAHHGLLDVVEHLVNDLVGTDLDALFVRQLAGLAVGADVEADD